LRAVSLYLILSCVYDLLPLFTTLLDGFISPNIIIVISRLFQAGIGLWIVTKLLSTKTTDQNYARLIGLYIILSQTSNILNFPLSIRGIASLIRYYLNVPSIYYLLTISTRVITILYIIVSIKLFRKQVDQKLFLYLSIIQLMHIFRVLYHTDFEWILISIPRMQANLYLIHFLANIALYSMLVIVFLVISGKLHVWEDKENRVIKWIGVALFLMGFLTLSNWFKLFVYGGYLHNIESLQGILLLQWVLLPIIDGIKALVSVYLSTRVFRVIPISDISS